MSAQDQPALLEKLCVHTITLKQWSLAIAAAKFAQAGVKGITVWRDALTGLDAMVEGRRLRELGLSVVSLCRGGFFPGLTRVARQESIDQNRAAIHEAAVLGAPMVVLVCGANPGIPLAEARKQIEEGIATLLPDCAATGVKLAIEPLHPMYADLRSAVNTFGQANDICDRLNSPYVGVAADVYHIWWDPNLQAEIERCGRAQRLFGFHVCDWLTPTADFLNDRGLMGEGCIPICQIRSWVEAAGFAGFNEVEIFSTRLWALDPDIYLKKIINAYQAHV